MLCDICHKREATIHVTEIINNEVQEIHVCEECAEKKGMVTKQNFGLAGFLGGLADFGFTSEEEAVNEVELKCPGCGLTLTDFKKIGRLGCDRCYETFQKALLPLLRKIHGTAQRRFAPERLVSSDEGLAFRGPAPGPLVAQELGNNKSR